MSLLLAATAAPVKSAAAAAATVKATLAPLTHPLANPALNPIVNAPAPVVTPPPTFFQAHAGWLTHGLAGIFVICAVLLVALLAAQTTKQEGLSGTLGGRVDSAYRGRLGADEQIKRITGAIAVAFVVIGTILSLTGI